MANLVRMFIMLLAGGIALVYGAAGFWPGSMLSVAVGLVWLTGHEMRRDATASAGLVAFTALAAIGLFWRLSAWAMLLGVVGALVTWDLHLFGARLAQAAYVQDHQALLRAHCGRLAIVAALSIILAGLGLGIKLRLNLVAALGLGSLAALLLARFLRPR